VSVPHSSRGLGHRPLKAEIIGSNPICGTTPGYRSGVTCTADELIERLRALRPPGSRSLDDYAGVGMGRIFELAKACMDMPPGEIERLLEEDAHAIRVAAVSVMDWQARSRRTGEERRRDLFELYIRRHDRIDTWDLVDRSAINVVGGYLVDRPREVLDRLAASTNPMERRTAILSSYAFMRTGDVGDTFRLAEVLVGDPEDTVHKAVGWMLREAGKRDRDRHAAFLARHAGTMPRVMLRYAIEKLDKPERDRYLAMRSSSKANVRA
jgi:3-methyladenine DNA glycosylase AlkD